MCVCVTDVYMCVYVCVCVCVCVCVGECICSPPSHLVCAFLSLKI